MKIGIIGTRGIPNNYGGFEQFAEYLSVGLVKKGHEVFVYNSHNHSYKESTWNGVQIIHKYDPEFKIGTAGQFIYDLNCIIDSRKRRFDVILNLGYTSSSVWSRFFPSKSLLITNMDGLEWKRTKFSKKVQRFLKYAEKLAVKHSDVLVADSEAIKDYLHKTYGAHSHFIAYGAEVFQNPHEDVIGSYKVSVYGYNMLVARMEPENNIEIILDGVHKSSGKEKCLVIGNFKNEFGTYLFQKYSSDDRIVFLGAVYDLSILNNLRFYSRYYFHGHSVGGTNPSLLEAMASSCFIISHNNEFNKSVLRDNALYFNNAADITTLLDKPYDTSLKASYIMCNKQKIETTYSWENIINLYETLMLNSLKNHE